MIDLGKAPKQRPETYQPDTETVSPIEAFSEEMSHHDLIPETIEPDGKIHRFNVGKRKDKSGWYVFYLGNICAGAFGNWATGLKQNWCAVERSAMTDEESARYQAKIEAARKQREEKEARLHEQARERANDIWNRAKPADPDHPYLKRKNVSPFGIRQLGKTLIVPLEDEYNTIWSLQRIFPDGKKLNLKDGRKKGLLFAILGDEQLYIAEGYSTAATIHAATGGTVLVSFDAGNLVEVAKTARKYCPNKQITICADNDTFTETGNTGLNKACEAAKAINAKLAIPRFENLSSKPTDFNDLQNLNGIDEVRRQIEGQTQSKTGFRLIHISEIKTRRPDFVIDKMIERDSLNVVVGNPGTGKTFLAIAMACSVASGQDFYGHKTKKGPVVYIAGEGQSGLKRRLDAWAIKNQTGLSSLPIYVSQLPAALCDSAQIAEVIKAIDDVTNDHGPPSMIVFDTVARNFGPGDENSTKDMTFFVQSLDEIRTRYHAAILLVHHTGLVDKTRSRGSSVLKGALDSEFLLNRDENKVVRLECTKMKDFEEPKPMAFRLRTVELGCEDDEGTAITSAVLDSTTYEPPPVKGKAGRGKWQILAIEVLKNLHKTHSDNLAASGYDPAGARVSVEEWRVACQKEGMNRETFRYAKNKVPELIGAEIQSGYINLYP